MRKKKADGTYYYYYYKKKIGRHKKSGPKKKPRKRGRSWQEPWDFKIVGCIFNKQRKYVGIYHDLEEAEFIKEKLLQDNANIVFPVKYTNNGRRSSSIVEYKSEYLILKKIRDPEVTDKTTKLRNEFGMFVDHTTNSERWVIYDKFPWVIEETFWVYGYNPKNDRKEYVWIQENLVENKIQTNYDIINIFIWGNKVIFRYDEDFDFVICKNKSDAVRMYNLLEKDNKKNKHVIFTGLIKGHSDRVSEIAEMIHKKTGWTINKIYKTETRT